MTRAAADDAVPLGASFRDPSGFMFRRDGVLYRQINGSYAATYARCKEAGLYERLSAAGLLIGHEEVPRSLASTSAAAAVIRPELVPFISYPYEWCFSQLQEAALLTLQIQRQALDLDFCLRDASAYNVQFRDGRPVFIDTLSFGPWEPGQPWVAYRQFCQHFLAPLAVMSLRDIRLQKLLRTNLDGLPLDLAARLLPSRSKLRPGLLLHIQAHAAMARHRSPTPARSSGFGENTFRGMLDSLEAAVRKLSWEPKGTVWADYYDDVRYADEAMNHKIDTVARWLDQAEPGLVYDLGANTGRFSRLATERGRLTVALDFDPATVERAWRDARGRQDPLLLPLVMDLANPSPGLGWAGTEREALEGRGEAAVVLALALVHHLAIGGNVPFEKIARYLHRLGRQLVIEFVPREDPRVVGLLAGREDVFADYNAAAFEAAFSRFYRIVARERLTASPRVLYLMERA